MNQDRELQWSLIIGMGALILLHPFMNLTGLIEVWGRPEGPRLINLLISGTWLVIVVFGGVRRPVLTLCWAGVVAGLFILLTRALLGSLFMEGPTGPLVNLFATVGIMVTNTLWGLALGGIAWAIQTVMRRRGAVGTE